MGRKLDEKNVYLINDAYAINFREGVMGKMKKVLILFTVQFILGRQELRCTNWDQRLI